MKKILLVAAVASLSLVSCKKEYTCECTTTDSSDPSFTMSASVTATMKKSEADSWCGGQKSSVGTISTSCKLK